jgi:hypothetical protein
LGYDAQIKEFASGVGQGQSQGESGRSGSLNKLAAGQTQTSVFISGPTGIRVFAPSGDDFPSVLFAPSKYSPILLGLFLALDGGI